MRRRPPPPSAPARRFGGRGAPWSIGAIVNQPLASDIVGGQSFLWNVSASYVFK